MNVLEIILFFLFISRGDVKIKSKEINKINIIIINFFFVFCFINSQLMMYLFFSTLLLLSAILFNIRDIKKILSINLLIELIYWFLSLLMVLIFEEWSFHIININ